MNLVAEIGPQEVGRRLIQIRESARIKQAELARKITWSPAVLSRVESGERALSPDELRIILEAVATPEAVQLSNALSREWQVLPRPPLDHSDQDVLWEAEQACRDLVRLRDQPDIRRAFERRLSEYLDEIQKMAQLLLKREHEIAFIGSIGIGKSTAICKLTGLEVVSPDGGPATPVLEVGAGGVTICEVQLRTGPSYGIVIEPCSDEEIRAHVTDFAEHILRGGADQSEADGDDDESQGISHEIERAVRNLASVRMRREKGPDGKTIRRDEAKDLATNKSVREYVVELLTRMELHRRDRRDIWYDASAGKPPLAWLRDTFELINNGRHPDFTLPTRIEIVVPQQLLGPSDLAIRLIDTKGIDRTAARADLEKHLEEPHTVAVLCSGFNDAPGATARLLLERARRAAVRSLELTTALLILPRPDEALAFKDNGIRVENVAEGYELKHEQIATALEPLGVPQLTVGFFNAFGDEPTGLRNLLTECLLRIRATFRRRLADASQNARTLIMNQEKEQVQAVLCAAARMMTTWVSQFSAIPSLPGHVQDSLISQMRAVYASTIRATVRREGEWPGLSYAYHLGYGGRRLAASALESLVDGFKQTTLLMEANPDFKEAKDLTHQARQVLETAFEELLRKAQIMGQTVFGEALRRDPSFWLACQEEWGKGAGYRDRVTGRNRDWFGADERKAIEQELWGMVAKEWGIVLERLASLLETDNTASQ
jgi:transcriptional regulator with XRE-family HTH domain